VVPVRLSANNPAPSPDVTAMRIYYLSPYNLRQPRRTTNRVSDVRFCRSLAMTGVDVRLICPYVYRRDNASASAVLDLYGAKENLSLTILRTPLWDGARPWMAAAVRSVAALGKYLAIRQTGEDAALRSVWISRDHNAILPLIVASRLLGERASKIVYWAHEYLPRHRRIAWIYRNADAVLATNSAILDDLETDLGVPRERTAVTLNPVSADLFREPPSREAARRKLGIPLDEALVVYTGKLARRLKEAEYIIEAARMLPDYSFVMTGGKRDVVSYWQARCEEMGVRNVKLVGFLPDPNDVRSYQIAADALISYYTRENKLLDYNFPQKVTEYMASGAPIVTPEYRATKDVLHPGNALLVAPESPPALAAGIRKAIEDRALGHELAGRAFRQGREITLERRGAETVAFLRRIAA
jgi:glycosyltransferase involved in cell wall biosynthesis